MKDPGQISLDFLLTCKQLLGQSGRVLEAIRQLLAKGVVTHTLGPFDLCYSPRHRQDNTVEETVDQAQECTSGRSSYHARHSAQAPLLKPSSGSIRLLTEAPSSHNCENYLSLHQLASVYTNSTLPVNTKLIGLVQLQEVAHSLVVLWPILVGLWRFYTPH